MNSNREKWRVVLSKWTLSQVASIVFHECRDGLHASAAGIYCRTCGKVWLMR